MFHKVKCAATGVFILFLLLAFTLPGAWLDRSCETLLALTEEAARAEDPASALERLYAGYEQNSRGFRLFLDHGAVNTVGAAIAAARPLREREALLSALSVVREAIAGLMRIESFEMF